MNGGGNARKLRLLYRQNIELRRLLREATTTDMWTYSPILDEPPLGHDWEEIIPPRQCAECEDWFVPMKTNQRYCTSRCADRKVERTPERREYQRMHHRWSRGTIDDAEWNEWKASR